MRLSTFNINDNYTSLDVAFDNLYIDGGGITSTKFSSLDTAFKLQPINPKQTKEINSKKAIEEYNNVTNNLSNIKYSNARLY